MLTRMMTGYPPSSSGISWKFIPYHPVIRGQRKEDRGYHSQELHIFVLFRVNDRLIRIPYLLGIFQQMAGAVLQPVRPVRHGAEIPQLLLGKITVLILFQIRPISAI